MPEGNCVFCFIDDIILATESEELHYKIIEVIFYICTQYGLTLKPGKCATGYDCIEYLGNMVSGKATWPTPHRVKALVNMALPTTVAELRSFLKLLHVRFSVRRKHNKLCFSGLSALTVFR